MNRFVTTLFFLLLMLGGTACTAAPTGDVAPIAGETEVVVEDPPTATAVGEVEDTPTTEIATEVAPAEASGPSIGLVLPSLQSQFYQNFIAGAQQSAAEFNIDLRPPTIDAEFDPDRQREILYSFIDEGVDALIIFSRDPYLANEFVTAASDAGIPALTISFDDIVQPTIANITLLNVMEPTLTGGQAVTMVNDYFQGASFESAVSPAVAVILPPELSEGKILPPPVPSEETEALRAEFAASISESGINVEEYNLNAFVTHPEGYVSAPKISSPKEGDIVAVYWDRFGELGDIEWLAYEVLFDHESGEAVLINAAQGLEVRVPGYFAHQETALLNPAAFFVEGSCYACISKRGRTCCFGCRK